MECNIIECKENPLVYLADCAALRNYINTATGCEVKDPPA